MRISPRIYFLSAITIFMLVASLPETTGKVATKKMAKKIPLNFKDVNDLGFSKHQDTVYYNNTPFTGIQFSLYPNGDTAFAKPYYAGLEEGWIKEWYPNNKQLAEKRFYISGRKEGLHQAWWPNGTAKFRYEFDNDEFNGVNKEWYENGALFKLFHYTKGYEDGSQQMYWANGKIKVNYIIKNKRRYGLLGTKNCINVADSIFIER